MVGLGESYEMISVLVPNTVQVGDMGIDGKIYPVGTKPSDQNDMFARGNKRRQACAIQSGASPPQNKRDYLICS
jgi:hypothetical protein